MNSLFFVSIDRVMKNNLKRSYQKEYTKNQIAVSGIRDILEALNNKPWNPEHDKVVAEVVVDLENLLRNIYGLKQTKSPSRLKLLRQKVLWQLQTWYFQFLRVWDVRKA